MKKLFFLALLSCLNLQLSATIGCMANSWNLEKEYDSKDYHYVDCACPCNQLNDDRNECRDCGHFHEGRPWIIIDATDSRQSKQPKKTSFMAQYPQTNTIIEHIKQQSRK